MLVNKTSLLPITIGGKTKEFLFLELDQIDSTNDFLKRQAMSGDNRDWVVRASFQTHGRGQFDRTWQSPPEKNLLFSILMHPNWAASETTLLTIRMAEVISRVLKEVFDLSCEIKKPNDVYCSGKKIAGILTEQATHGAQIDYVIVGVGVNANASAADLLATATSIQVESGAVCDLRFLLQKMLETFLSIVPSLEK